jgi:selenocysteine-specific elongation factor
VIIATAGHIDHGKTSLVKALTGVDTDRLPEERARGISIELGFAHCTLGSRGRVSFVDVPGHERFIRNMIAGVGGIDAALMVVAADDGLMPQTLEHLQILDLLGVDHGVIAVTKTDLVAPERVAAVVAEVRAALAPTSLRAAAVIPVSAHSGQGMQDLLAWFDQADADLSRPPDEDHHFRLPVDRAFVIAGRGTVVTGTIHSGAVALGDLLRVSPCGREVRVRGIQIQGETADSGQRGQRCALNLVGASVEDVRRGDWILHAAAHAPTQRLDVRLNVLQSDAGALRHWTPVHLHIGTMDVPARIAVAGEASIESGASGFVQLITDRPIAALHADRFIVRCQSARRTLGGGIVLDPFAPTRKRKGGLRTAVLQAYERPSASGVLTGLLELSDSGVDLHAFAQAMNLVPTAALAAVRAAQAVPLGKERPTGLGRAAADALVVRVLNEVKSFHEKHPNIAGVEVARLHAALAPRLNSAAFQALVRELANRQLLVLSNDVARLSGHEAAFSPPEERLWARVHAVLLRSGAQVPLTAELAQSLGVGEQLLRDLLHRKSRSGAVRRITATRFGLRETLAQLAAATVAVAAGKDDGFFSAADFRDAIGTGRGLAIHILEYFDQTGITQRFGDRRRVGKDFADTLGNGPAP